MAVGRFNNLLNRACPRPNYDRVMFDLNTVVVSPTLGSIIPHWVLAIPKQSVQNFSVWSGDDREAPRSYIFKIARLANRAPEGVLWFEHGSNSAKSAIGCGVDHAHLHILLSPPFSFLQFKDAAKAAVALSWEEGTGNPYDRLGYDQSYLVAGAGNEYFFARSVEKAGSQFFRRVIAGLAGKPDEWDYKLHQHPENVDLTLAFSAERAA